MKIIFAIAFASVALTAHASNNDSNPEAEKIINELTEPVTEAFISQAPSITIYCGRFFIYAVNTLRPFYYPNYDRYESHGKHVGRTFTGKNDTSRVLIDLSDGDQTKAIEIKTTDLLKLKIGRASCRERVSSPV